MKECKYCNAQMEDSSNFCPNCGKPWEEQVTEPEAAVQEQTAAEEAAAEETATEETAAEEAAAEETPAQEPEAQEPSAPIEEGIKATPGKIALVVIAIVLVLAALVAVVVKGTAGDKVTTPAETQVTVEESEPVDLMATEATIPADGNPDDVTCKGSYTADDETVIAAGDTVIATMGDQELTISRLQVYYWLEVNSFLNMLYNYGMDASYYGMDYTLGLDYQACAVSAGHTWQQFFLESALGSWKNYQALALEAKEAGFQLEETYQAQLDNIHEDLQLTAESYGMADAKELLSYNVGNCAEIEDYHYFLENNYVGGSYLDSLVTAMDPTMEEMEAYYLANEEAYVANGLTLDMCSVDVRHILVFPEGADSSSIYTETFSEEAWAAGEQKAQEILDLWLAGEMTEESFASVANEYSADPGSNTNGGLYTEVMQGDVVPEFDAWCFDAVRQVGDYAIVRTDLGFHIMYFSGKNLLWPTYVRQDMQTEYQNELVNQAVEKYDVEIDYSAILLSYLNLAG